MTDDSEIKLLSFDVTEGMMKELRKGYDKTVSVGIEISFDKYIVACMMLGHHTMHKCLGMIDIMLQEAEREKEAKE